ncbi:MAG: hypothetical protein ABJC89_02285 [Acidobacteriota bacterium]
MLSAVSFAAQGARITRIEFTPSPLEQGPGILVGILGTGECKYDIDFGDGESARRTADLPDRIRHVYAADAEYTVTASPTPPCEGVARARIDVRAVTRGIWRLVVEPGPATDAPEVIVTIEGRGTCTVNMEFGDAKTQQLDVMLPARVNHIYPSPGTYEIRARADEPCRGDTTIKVDVRR